MGLAALRCRKRGSTPGVPTGSTVTKITLNANTLDAKTSSTSGMLHTMKVEVGGCCDLSCFLPSCREWCSP